MGTCNSAWYVALLAVHRSRREGREVDIGPTVRHLVVDHDPAGSSESARGRHATGCRCAGAGGGSERSCDRRALQESSCRRSHAKEQPVRRAVVKLGQGRTLVPPRSVYQKGGLTRAGDNVTGKREEIHLWIRWYASVIHESARDHVSRGRPIHPERVIKCSRVYVFPRAVSGPGR